MRAFFVSYELIYNQTLNYENLYILTHINNSDFTESLDIMKSRKHCAFQSPIF